MRIISKLVFREVNVGQVVAGNLVREIPEALKPRKISIESAGAVAPAQIEAQKAA